MDKRDFLKLGVLGVGAGCLSGCSGAVKYISTLSELVNERILEEKIWGMRKYIHLAEYTGKVKGRERKMRGYGTFVDGYYISTAHIPEALSFVLEQVNPFQRKIVRYPVKDKKMNIKGKDFDILVEDYSTDVLIAKQRGKSEFEDFPAEPFDNIDCGDLAYILGNPRLNGWNLRKSHISDLNGYASKSLPYKLNNSFGLRDPVHGGDSGTPVVSINDGEIRLIGLSQYFAYMDHGKLGYVSRIKNYTDVISKLRAKEGVTKNTTK